MAAFDATHFQEAHGRYLTDAKTLTDADLELFTLVDAKFAERARAKRAGFVEAEKAETTKAFAKPLTRKDLSAFMTDFVAPILATHRYKAREAEERIFALERRVLELEAEAAARAVTTNVDR